MKILTLLGWQVDIPFGAITGRQAAEEYVAQESPMAGSHQKACTIDCRGPRCSPGTKASRILVLLCKQMPLTTCLVSH